MTRLISLFERVLQPARRARMKAAGVDFHGAVTLRGAPHVALVKGSTVTIGDRVALVSTSRSTALGVTRPVILRTLTTDAFISIGDDSGLSGTVICSAQSVSIGARVLIGSEVMICDTDFHPVDEVRRRYAPIPAPRKEDSVILEDDVFVGARVTILKGSRIGRGSVIGAGSVVSGNIPAHTIAAGVPARVVREIADSEDNSHPE